MSTKLGNILECPTKGRAASKEILNRIYFSLLSAPKEEFKEVVNWQARETIAQLIREI